ncbi:Os01g0105500 [Oryza sativa Japonica Group]|uniref:Os01g0105500 protein n=1 Tax=Oryza sativa subsp. japonica TaxID=39947 RepID=C7IWV9_ORYSJ|nr:Os01g0105500 [Oryza sativa Japonica Group]|eukprot:NP_001172118.1 Os01g0105500 [Oryza sativa Japonica Group]
MTAGRRGGSGATTFTSTPQRRLAGAAHRSDNDDRGCGGASAGLDVLCSSEDEAPSTYIPMAAFLTSSTNSSSVQQLTTTSCCAHSPYMAHADDERVGQRGQREAGDGAATDGAAAFTHEPCPDADDGDGFVLTRSRSLGIHQERLELGSGDEGVG